MVELRVDVFFVYEFINTAGLHHKFPVRGRDWTSKLTVTNGQALVLTILPERYSF